MRDRKWNKGPPPHAGWWNASFYTISQAYDIWRWWDGRNWSDCAIEDYTIDEVVHSASTVEGGLPEIWWTDYWPENARVDRIAP